MTFSSLISGTIPHHDKYNIRSGKVTRVIQHHWAGTSGGIERLSNPKEKASATYIVLSDGRILGQVPEEYRPWTSGGYATDNPSITIECQNSTGAPDYKVSDKAYASLIRLLVDIDNRHGFGILTRTKYCGHREFAATACPGPYLYPRLQAICDAVNGVLPHPVPTPTPTPVGKLVVDGSFGPLTIKALQRNLGVEADGLFGPNTKKMLQHFLGVKADGLIGPITIKALQRHVGVTADGSWGPITTSAIQRNLNAGTF
jgi:peptidoglycan hydrolase-like protein with peptidoglycan-binding domain